MKPSKLKANLLYQNFIILMIFIFIISCKRNEPANPDSDPHIEVTPCYSNITSPIQTLVPGDYIVAYHSIPKAARLFPGKTNSVIARMVLKNSNIDTTSLIETFEGFQKGFLCRLSESDLKRLRRNPDIAFIEQDRSIYLNVCVKVVDSTTISWGTKRVGYGNGTGRTAWIIDTGIDINHEDLNVDTQRSRCFIEGITSINDESGHGTHVAGIIGAKNNNIGTLGVASGANLVALRVLDAVGHGKISAVLRALNYVHQNAKRGDVVNISLVSDTISKSIDNEVIGIANEGILFSIASGNGGSSAALFSPCHIVHPNVFVVSAMNDTDTWASFSNYGSGIVKWAAPGVSILSTQPRNQYGEMSGTSMAAPHMAGLLLLDGRNIGMQGEVKKAPDIGPYLIPHKR